MLLESVQNTLKALDFKVNVILTTLIVSAAGVIYYISTHVVEDRDKNDPKEEEICHQKEDAYPGISSQNNNMGFHSGNPVIQENSDHDISLEVSPKKFMLKSKRNRSLIT